MTVVVWAVFAAASARAAATAPANPGAETCLACHSDPAAAPDPQLKPLSASAHRRVACDGCHKGTGDVPHAASVKVVDCGNCHKSQTKTFKASPHGAAILKKRGPAIAEACAPCHGKGHAIAKVASADSPVAKPNEPATCGACHAVHGIVPAEIEARKPVATFLRTIHGEALQSGNLKAAACKDCHGSHDIRPPSDPASRVSAMRIASTCGKCHTAEAGLYAESIHGTAVAQGVRAAPTCTDCHGEHDIRPPSEAGSRLAPAARTKVCADCHRSARIAAEFSLPLDRVRTFETSFHGLAARGGDLRVAGCASCHGWHDVLPSNDPRSRVNPAHLPETCGRCHPGAGKRWPGAGMKVHELLAREAGGSALAVFVKRMYLIAIPFSVCLMLLHNALDLGRKARGPRRWRHREGEVALSVPERWQHAANGVAFILLAYSGFALQHGDVWWAAPLRALGGEGVRRGAHRAAAALFLLTAAAHLTYLATKKGRARLKSMAPAWRDLRDPVALLGYNVGAAARAPLLPQFSYIEKFEYWALIWGSMVMTVTGGLLFFHNLALAILPLWTIEVARIAHYMEAVLACLAILIWHGYWVVFDPEVYPLDWAWLFGTARLPSAPAPADETKGEEDEDAQ